MARKEFEQIVAQAPFKNMISFVMLDAITVKAGTSKLWEYFAPVNSIVHVKAIDFMAGNYTTMGATSGTHELLVGYPNINPLAGTSSWNGSLHLAGSTFSIADQKQTPNDLGAQASIVHNLAFDEYTPLCLTYQNNTNADMTGSNITIRIWGMQEMIKEES